MSDLHGRNVEHAQTINTDKPGAKKIMGNRVKIFSADQQIIIYIVISSFRMNGQELITQDLLSNSRINT